MPIYHIVQCIAFIKFKQSVQDAPFLKSIIVAVSRNFHMKAELFDKGQAMIILVKREYWSTD